MIEVLAPAGTYESFEAAVCAGADAVYLGGSMFGARAFAGNFNEEELCRAIEYAHLYDRKVYLTVNTLVKEEELETRLFDYILPYYERGLDAVIVQDFGVFRFIKRNFPALDIHASTQMTIAGHLGAAQIAAAGASRVVTPRELTLEEIAQIRRENPNLEIESFVHGALCYCYSGQCLMSSLIGGRSGNRGRCAQSCRLAYEVFGEGKRQNGADEQFVLSPRDMCALENLPQIIAAGVNSLKIEGRMKNPEYTAGVVSIYRKYVDLYIQNGVKDYVVSAKDIEALMDLYNRGNFTKGYYTEVPGRKMMSMERPNHRGVRALEVVQAKKGEFRARPLTVLNGGDVVEITPEYEITVGAKDAGKEELVFRIPSKFSVKRGQVLYRTRNASLLQTIRSEYLEKEAKRDVSVSVVLHKQKEAVLTLSCADIRVSVTGGLCEAAGNCPLTRQQVERQLKKFGNTGFLAEKVSVDMEEDIFIPMGVLSELRRNAADKLSKTLAARYYRGTVKLKKTQYTKTREPEKMRYSVYVSREEQIEPVLSSGIFSRVYLDAACLSHCRGREQAEAFRKSGAEVYFAFPGIFRARSEKYLNGLLSRIKECEFDGYLVRSLCEIAYIREKGLAGKIVSDHNLYVWNREAADFLREQGVDMLTAPVEQNERELSRLNPQGMEIIGYGYYPMMTSAQCVRKNLAGCRKQTEQENDIWQLVDRKKNSFPVVSDCRNCRTTIYNTAPVNLLDRCEVFQKWGISLVRVQFTVETEEQTRELLSKMRLGAQPAPEAKKYTRGHFTRGVE